MEQSVEANKRIAELVDPAYLERIPSFVRDHAITGACSLISREFSGIYEVFSREEEPAEDAREQMRLIVNDIYRERMAKHNL